MNSFHYRRSKRKTAHSTSTRRRKIPNFFPKENGHHRENRTAKCIRYFTGAECRNNAISNLKIY